MAEHDRQRSHHDTTDAVIDPQAAARRAGQLARERGQGRGFSRAALMAQQGDLSSASGAGEIAAMLYAAAAREFRALAEGWLPAAATPAAIPCPVQSHIPRPVPRPDLQGF